VSVTASWDPVRRNGPIPRRQPTWRRSSYRQRALMTLRDAVVDEAGLWGDADIRHALGRAQRALETAVRLSALDEAA
jgi:hypothetical protein